MTNTKDAPITEADRAAALEEWGAWNEAGHERIAQIIANARVREQERVTSLVQVKAGSGRLFLDVAGCVTAVQGQTCRDGEIALNVEPEYPMIRTNVNFEPSRLWDNRELQYVVDRFAEAVRKGGK